MRTSNQTQNSNLVLIGSLGGIAGGLTEIAWVSAYGMATGTPLAPIARGIVQSVIPAVAESPAGPAFGIIIHLALAVLVGIGLAIVIGRLAKTRLHSESEFAVAVLALLAIWAVNFFIVLPNLNPAFVGLLPYSVTLVSKLLFGLAAAVTFRASRLRRPRAAF